MQPSAPIDGSPGSPMEPLLTPRISRQAWENSQHSIPKVLGLMRLASRRYHRLLPVSMRRAVPSNRGVTEDCIGGRGVEPRYAL